MTMARYLRGTPVMTDYLPSVAYSAGDVIVVGAVPFVAHGDNPPNTTDPKIQGALACQGAEYIIPADAAYSNGTFVFWNSTTQQVTTVQVAGQTVPFGEIVGGPNFRLDDGGPTGAASLCVVLHNPFRVAKPSTQYTSIAAGNGTLAAGNMEGAQDVTLASSGATAMTTRTAAQIIAGVPNLQVGDSYKLRVYNTNAGTLTLTGGVGVTITGTATIATAKWRDYYVTYTAVGAITMQNLGSGTAD